MYIFGGIAADNAKMCFAWRIERLFCSRCLEFIASEGGEEFFCWLVRHGNGSGACV